MSTNTTVKEVLTFTEYKAVCDKVANTCFPDNIYSPEYRDLIEIYSLILAYVPDYNFEFEEINNDNVDEVYTRFYSEEVSDIYNNIKKTKQYDKLIKSIDEAIEYRKNLIYKASAYSETDIALSSFVFKLEEIIGKISENVSEENISKAIKFLTTFGENKDNFAISKIIDTLISKKVIGKEFKKPIKTK